jgi:hypothetical protein
MSGLNTIQIEIDGLKCECVERTRDSFERSIVAHRIIGFNGCFLEDSGLNSRSIELETLWHNENYNNHEIFLAEYSETFGPNKIVHPVYGTVWGKIQSVCVVHNSIEKRAAHISLRFLENGEPQTKFKELHLYGTAAANTQSVVGEMLQIAQSQIGKRAGLINKMNDVRSMMATSKARVSQGINVFNTVIDSITYPSTLAGEMVEIAVNIVDSANSGVDKLVQSPAAAIFGVRERLLLLRTQISRQPDLGGDILADLVLSYTLFNECLLVARVNDEYESSRSSNFVESANIASGLARSIKNLKKFALEIISANRTETKMLAKTVATVAEGVEQTLANSSAEREIEINGETSIYTVLLAQGIMPEYAEIICRRNNIENPNKVSGKIFVPIINKEENYGF